MIVTSFFPGRIRLRAPAFKDQHLYNHARYIIEKAFGEVGMPESAIKTMENNSVTGSVLIEYRPERIPVQKLAAFKDFFKKLGSEAEAYTPSEENRKRMITLLDQASKYL